MIFFQSTYFHSRFSNEVASENNLDKYILAVLLFNKYLQKNLVFPFSSCSRSLLSLFVFEITLLRINLFLELVFLSSVALLDGKPPAASMHRELCCQNQRCRIFVCI